MDHGVFVHRGEMFARGGVPEQDGGAGRVPGRGQHLAAGSEGDRRPVGDETSLVTWNWRIVNQDDEVVCRVAIEALYREPVEVTV